MSNEIRFQAPPQIERDKPIAIPVTVVLARPLKVRGIHAKFHGAEETKATYTTTSSDGKGRTTTQTHTAVQHVDITTQADLVKGNERLSFFGNLSDAVATIFGGGEHEVMQPGKYEFAVEVSIPADAPPTCVGKKIRVFYELSVLIDVPLAFDLKATHSFQLPPLPSSFKTVPVRTKYPEDAGRGLFDSMFAPDVRIEVALAADKVRLGKSISGIFVLETKKPLSCNGLRVRLLGIENTQADGHTDRHVHKGDAIELDTPGLISGTYTQEFALPAEVTGPTSARGQLFTIEWYVQIELDVPWAKDPTVRAPIELLLV